MKIDAILKLSLITAVASRRGQIAFKICAILTYLAYLGFATAKDLRSQEALQFLDFSGFTGSDYAYMLALLLMDVAIPLLISTGILYLIRRDVENYVTYCISGTFTDALFRFSIIPVVSWLVVVIFAADRSDMTASGAVWVIILAAVPLTYLTSLWSFVVLLALLYLPTRLILLILNRLCLRIAESTRGPVLAISSIFAIGGAVLDLTTATK
jgi:hypothetical protein